MIDINLIRENPEVVRASMKKRGIDPSPVDQAVKKDAYWRKLLIEAEALKAERNKVSKEIGNMKDKEERQSRIDEMKVVSDRIKELDEQLRQAEEEMNAVLSVIPNVLLGEVPEGTRDEDNIEVRRWGDLPEFDFEPKPHWDLGPELGIIDFEAGVKITGSRFYVLSGAGARLQRSVIHWMLDLHQKQGYTEKYTPFLVRKETVFGAGQLPKFKDNLYKDHEEDLYLLPTSEVSLTGLHMNEILEEEDLPLHYTAYSPCFRREKMSAGRDVRGIKRGHQFDKVEMYKYCMPENSMDELKKMVADAEETCKLLPQRAGDLRSYSTDRFCICVGVHHLGFSLSRAAYTFHPRPWDPDNGCVDIPDRLSGVELSGKEAVRACGESLHGAAAGETAVLGGQGHDRGIRRRQEEFR